MIGTTVKGVQAVGNVNPYQGAKKAFTPEETFLEFNQVMSQSLTDMGNNTFMERDVDSDIISMNSSKDDFARISEKAETSDVKSKESQQFSKSEQSESVSKNQTKDNDKLGSDYKEAEAKLKEEIKSTLNVTDEEIENALNVLGFSLTDLFKTENMTEFVALVTGSEMMDILTDSSLSDALFSLQDFAKQLMEDIQGENQISMEELEQFLFVNDETVAQDGMTSDNMPEVTIQDLRTESAGSSEHKKESSDHPGADKNASQMILNQLGQAVAESSSVQQMGSVTSFQQASIINQIVEAARVTLTNQVTSMELMLNPESLGKVSLNVSIREGVVTAQIIAETQVAKEAIEGQIAVLREQLNQQGLKVEAVEVTIASHSFESGHDQNDNSAGTQNNKKNRKALNGLNMDGIDENDIDDTESVERMPADVVTGEGMLVNYRA